MKNIAKKLYYLFLTIIFRTVSISSMRIYLTLFKDHKSHPYIITGIYFISYLLFIIIFYFNLPKNKRNNSSDSDSSLRKRVNSIKLYKRNSIITVEDDKKNKEDKNKSKNKKDECNQCPNVYCIKNEVIYPSILLSFGEGFNIYTLGKINVTVFLMLNGSILICFFRIMKSRKLSKIKFNKVISLIIIVLSLIAFVIYNLCVSDFDISYLFFILLNFFASIMICSAKYYNYNTIHRYSIDFISNNITIGDKGDTKEAILIENNDYIEDSNKKTDEINSINSADDIDINSTGSSLNNPIEYSNNIKTKKQKKKKKKQYFSYEKIVFYEGVLCFFFWLLLIFIISFIKCPENNRSMFKIFVCNNCTTMSGYETFFNSKELIIFNNVQYKNELIKIIYNYPICTIIFIIIIIITEFFYHFSFEKIFQGKYKTKLVLILNPIVALVVFGLRILGKKFSDVDSFVEKILPENLNISELILCIALFIGSIVSYLKICDFKCIKR